MAVSDLAVPACRTRCASAGLTMDQVDLVIMNTITPDHADPGCAFPAGQVGPEGIPVLDIKQQCAGMIYGLSLADHFVRAGTYRHVLVACAEKLSAGSTAPTRGATFRSSWATGRGAIVVGPDAARQRGILSTHLHADGSYAKALYTAAPGTALGRTDHVTTEDVESGRVHFRMDGKAVFQHGVEKMSAAVASACRPMA